MELYEKTSYQLAQKLTTNYSTSFSLSSRLFDESIRRHIYAIYGLVRIADEIVDTYQGDNAEKLLDELEKHVYQQLKSATPFSPNPIVHAFVLTAHHFAINRALIEPFFKSMRIDLTKTSFTQTEYEAYIYGSAEVIGLMCLRIFTQGDRSSYRKLEKGAAALGSAYQKVNFLRDMKADYDERGRCYFPGVTFPEFNDAQKKALEATIEAEFLIARDYISQLPHAARRAVRASYDYYWELLVALKKADAKAIKARRLRVPSKKKLSIYVKSRRR